MIKIMKKKRIKLFFPEKEKIFLNLKRENV